MISRSKKSIVKMLQKPVRDSLRSNRLLHTDPTRTGMLRQQFLKQITLQFDALKADVLKAIGSEDWLGLATTTNCNPDQMRDASLGRCGPGGAVGINREDMPQIKSNDLQEFIAYCRDQGVQVHATVIKASELKPTQNEFRQERVDAIPDEALNSPILTSSDNRVLDGTHRWIKQWQRDRNAKVSCNRVDLPLHEALDLMRGFPKVVFAANALGFSSESDSVLAENTRWQFHTNHAKIVAFQKWLKQQIGRRIASNDHARLWSKYIQTGYKKGVGRAFDDHNRPRRALSTIAKPYKDKRGRVKLAPPDTTDFYKGGRDQFLRSSFANAASVDTLKQLVHRTYTDLVGVTNTMADHMRRTLADGLVQGKGARAIANDLAENVDGIGKKRALTIARTELVRAFSEGTLDGLENLGVSHVGAAVEWSTSGLNTVDKRGNPLSPCELCKPLQGIVLKISEARGLLPRHPSCMCSWQPAGVGEGDEDQLRTKPEIDAALEESGLDDVDISLSRPKSVFNIGFDELLLNSFCPTGPGGGVDPGCSPGAKHSSGLTVGDVHSKLYKGMHVKVEVTQFGFKIHGVPHVNPNTVHSSLSTAAKAVKSSPSEVNGWAFFGIDKPTSSPAVTPAKSPATVAPTATSATVVPVSKLPSEPNFVSSKVDIVAANKAAVAKLKGYALTGQLDKLKSEPPSPSPKVESYKADLIKAVEGHLSTVPAPIPSTSSSAPLPHLPNMEHSAWSLPKATSTLKVIADLPGSTHPQKVEDIYGNHFVMKKGADKADQLRNEVSTDNAYQAAGIATPKSGLVETSSGPIKYSQFLNGGQTLSEWKMHRTPNEIAAMHKEIGKGLAADALLANWDVIGLTADNIMIKNGKPYRVDNGGGLKYRAQGAPKGDKFGTSVTELKSMRDPNGVNPSAGEVFQHVTDHELADQIHALVPKKSAILGAIADLDTRATVAKRFEYLEGWASSVKDTLPTPSVPTSAPPSSTTPHSGLGTTTPATSLHTGPGIAAHIEKNQGKAKFTKLDLDKIVHLNPDGIKHGTLTIGMVHLNAKAKAFEESKPHGIHTNGAQLEQLKKILPAGTLVKKEHITKDKITKTYGDLGTFTTTKADPTAKPSIDDVLSSASGLTPSDRLYGVPGHLHGFLPEIKSDSQVTLQHSNDPDMGPHLTWKASLTAEEKSAIVYWKGGAQKYIKIAVATDKPTAHSTAFMSAISKAPHHVGVVYRGMYGDWAEGVAKQIADAGVGGQWSDNSPHCMSPNPAVAGDNFSNGKLLLRIVTKTGRPIYKEDGFSGDAPTSEKEVTGMPNVQYRIAGIHKNVDCKYSNHSYGGSTVEHVIDLVEM